VTSIIQFNIFWTTQQVSHCQSDQPEKLSPLVVQKRQKEHKQ